MKTQFNQKKRLMKLLCIMLCIALMLPGCSSKDSAEMESQSTVSTENVGKSDDSAKDNADSSSDVNTAANGDSAGSSDESPSPADNTASDDMSAGSSNVGDETGSISDDASSAPAEPEGPSLGEIDSVTETGLAFENVYIQKHLDFIESKDYKKLLENPGGKASSMSREYRADHLDKINFFWKSLSSVSLFIGGLEYDVKNEYQILVGSLMQSSAAREAFNDSCEQGYLLSAEEMLGGISQLLKNTEYVTYFAKPDNLEDIDKLVRDVDELANDLGALKIAGNMDLKAAKAKLPEYEKVYGEKWTALKEKLGLVFDEKDSRFLKGLLGGLEYAEGIETAFSNSFSEVMDQYLILSSCRRATEEYLSTWTGISAALKSRGDSEATKLAEAIDDYIIQIEGSKTDLDAQLIKKAGQAAMTNTAKWGLSLVNDELDNILDTVPILKGIRLGLSGGVKISNFVTNLDDSGYYGKMIMGGGLIADASFAVMREAEDRLSSNKSYSNAILFDEAFNIYKNVLMATDDYGIEYCQSIATAPIGHLLKYSVDDEIVGADLLTIDKLELSRIFCHYGSEVKNNGRPVVGLDSDVYYISYNDKSFEKTGVLGNFSTDYNTYNKLSKLTGQENTALTMANINSNIFIWNGNILTSHNYNGWYSFAFNGDPTEKPVIKGTAAILGASDSPCMLVYADHDSYQLHVMNADMEILDLGSSDYVSLLGFHGDSAYFAKTDSSTISFYRLATDAEDLAFIGSITVEVDFGMSGAYIGSVLFEEDGIYLTAGSMGGTGYFYSNGGLFRVDYEEGVDTLIASCDQYTLSFVSLYLKRDEDGNRSIYFGSGVDYSNVGAGSPSTRQGVYCYDLQTGDISSVSDFTLCEKNCAFMTDTAIMAYVDDSGVPRQIMTKKRANNLGYKNLGSASSDPYSVAVSLDVIDDYAYLYLRSMKLDDSASFGWRQGYKLIKSGLYRVNIVNSEEKVFTINEY